MADLAALQRQFYDRVVHGEPADGLLASGDAEVYAGMYTTRLIDAIAEDYPKLRAALGEDRFGDVVARYVRAHPPWSFTLREAGAALPSFLSGSELAPPWAADLAALERARVEVFDGPDADPLTQEAVAALGEGLPELALAWVPASVVVPVAWTIDDLWSAIEDEEPVPEPVADARVVLAWRRDLSVLHRTLDADEARLAPLLAQGTSFAAVCEVLGELHGDAASSRAVELLVRWLGAAALSTSRSSTR
jgi:hypothetical protein